MNERNPFRMKILGRTIEHLGSQMYKQRAPSLIELVANAWDANANNVWIEFPSRENYEQSTSAIIVKDDGIGMDEQAIRDCYMVVGRDRRANVLSHSDSRPIMGRKGIGKLAGFGMADTITITTWKGKGLGEQIIFSMDSGQLITTAGDVTDVHFSWETNEKPLDETWTETGTLVHLSRLKHATPLDEDGLKETLSRRFSRNVRGRMKIFVNGTPLSQPDIETIYSYPAEIEKKYDTHILRDGRKVNYRYEFAKSPIGSKEMQGFVIYANGRTAQSPPFFFNVESSASGQHSTKYVFGEILADYVDSCDTEGDVISTDRQELEWERDFLNPLREWGIGLTRKILRECADMKGSKLEEAVLSDPDLNSRIESLDTISKKEIKRFLKILGGKYNFEDEGTRDLASGLVKAYEFKQFHGILGDLESVQDDPEALSMILRKILDWKVLESRALLEIISGRLAIVAKLGSMIANDAPETASSLTNDNMHDLMAGNPWLFNPEWQVYVEEKTLGKLLGDQAKEYSEDIKAMRIDFLALTGEGKHVIVELKRSAYAVEMQDVTRLLTYKATLEKSYQNLSAVLIYGGTHNIPQGSWGSVKTMQGITIITWSELFKRASSFYSHYKDVLEGNVTASGFGEKATEVMKARKIVALGTSHRPPEERKQGLGSSGY